MLSSFSTGVKEEHYKEMRREDVSKKQRKLPGPRELAGLLAAATLLSTRVSSGSLCMHCFPFSYKTVFQANLVQFSLQVTPKEAACWPFWTTSSPLPAPFSCQKDILPQLCGLNVKCASQAQGFKPRFTAGAAWRCCGPLRWEVGW